MSQPYESSHDGISQENSGNETLRFSDMMKSGGAQLEALKALARNNPQAAFALHNYEVKHTEHTERGTALDHVSNTHPHSDLGRSGR